MSSSKVVIVTGASSGLGRAIALEFAQLDTTRVVICADLNPNAPSGSQVAQPTVEEIRAIYGGNKATFVKTDVSEAADVRHLIQSTVKQFGRLDVLINNAGIALESLNNRGPRLVHETDESTYTKTMDVNAKSVFLGCKFAVEQFRRQGLDSAGNRGFIINISSVYGLTGAEGHVSYCSSKGAVVQITRAVAVENAPFKIHCNAVCPGFIQTDMDSKLYEDEQKRADTIRLHPWGSLGQPKDVAHAASFLGSDKASWVTGVILPVDGGYTAI